MSNEKTGGPAFPTTPENVLTDAPMDGGMTLRDYFAAKVMQGMLASQVGNRYANESDWAAFAYIQADAMLKAREE